MAAHIEKTCPAAVVSTGYHGDKMWDSKLEAKYLNDQIIRGDISGLRCRHQQDHRVAWHGAVAAARASFTYRSRWAGRCICS